MNIDFNSFFKNGMKSVEKLALYVVGVLTTTGVINPHLPKDWLVASIGAVLTGMHLSTPKNPV